MKIKLQSLLILAAISTADLALTAPAHAHTIDSQQAVQRLLDERDIQNVMGYYEEYQTGGDFESVVKLFALDKADVSWSPGPGMWRGPRAVRAVLLAQTRNGWQFIAVKCMCIR